MSVFALICEYNPFHNGHKYLIEQVKNKGDTLITVMSGNFMQRGDIAVADKFSRAETAIRNGADIVIELPAVYACANAETFAKGGVGIISSLGIVDKLCFGAENDNISLLKQAAGAFGNKDFRTELKNLMDSGVCYPNAVQQAIGKVCSPAAASVIDKPNNILAIEYIKALSETDIEPIAVKRVGTAHDSKKITEKYTSASNIREMINYGRDYSAFVPGYSIDNPADIKNLERTILYKLRTLSKDEIKNLPDVTEGLENRIYDAVRVSDSIDNLFENIKTKRYTMARIRRVIISALLGINSDIQKEKPQYIRVLAFNKKGAEMMSEIKDKCPLPLITNVADGYKELSGAAKKVFDIDILASDIYNLATENIGACGNDFTKGVIRIC